MRWRDPYGQGAREEMIAFGAVLGADVGMVLGGGTGIAAGLASGGVGFGATPWLAAGGAGLGAVAGGIVGGAIYDTTQLVSGLLFGESGSTPADSLWMAKKKDIALVDGVVRRWGLDREQRRRLHDQLQHEKSGRRNVTLEEIEEIARELAEERRRKDKCD